jgi:hypothetical protein
MALSPSCPPLSWRTTRLRGPLGAVAAVWPVGVPEASADVAPIPVTAPIAWGASGVADDVSGVGPAGCADDVVAVASEMGEDGRDVAVVVHATASPAAAPSAPVLRKLRLELDDIRTLESFSTDLVVGASQRQQHQAAQARIRRRLLLLRTWLS